jgi:hypothetical protein
MPSFSDPVDIGLLIATSVQAGNNTVKLRLSPEAGNIDSPHVSPDDAQRRKQDPGREIWS